MRHQATPLLRSKRDISVAFQKCGEGIPLLALACRGLAGSGLLRTRPSSNRLELALPGIGVITRSTHLRCLRDPGDEMAARVGKPADGAVADLVMAVAPVNHETNLWMKNTKN